jgi:hypothetical protein
MPQPRCVSLNKPLWLNADSEALPRISMRDTTSSGNTALPLLVSTAFRSVVGSWSLTFSVQRDQSALCSYPGPLA